MCGNLNKRGECCVEKCDGGRDLDYDDCKSYTNQTACEATKCYWNPQGLPNGACIIDI